MALSPSRQNIRIEIKNDFQEEMEEDLADIGELSDGELEDGELSDSKSQEEPQESNLVVRRNVVANQQTEGQFSNGRIGFTSGIDVFSHDEQKKLENRAQRFGLDSSEKKAMTDELLQELYDSLGLTTAEESNIRFDSIHMYGTQEMTTQDIFDYFGKYGPSSIEWINDMSCNVVWHDRISVFRAFLALSKPIRGLTQHNLETPVPETEDKKGEGRSILLIAEKMDQDKENGQDGSVHVSDIPIKIPQGHWRLGDPYDKAKYLLLRFAKRTDKRPLRAERFNEEYKKFGKNFDAKAGLISASRKRKIQEMSYEDLDKPEPEEVKGNPWGTLARNWDYDPQEQVFPKDPEIPIKKISLRTGPSKSLLNRIGTEKSEESESDEDDNEKKPKKSKIPRMRMYADEEEAKQKRKLEIKQIKKLEAIEEKLYEVPDLRSRLKGKKVRLENLNHQNINRTRLELKKTVPTRNDDLTESDSSDSEYSDDDLNVSQRSKIAVVVRKQNKPTVASTVWSRLDREKQRLQIKREFSDSERRKSSSESEQSDSNSDSETNNQSFRKTLSKTMNERPGFKTTDLKSRLGFQPSEHKSPLRIEINNDHYKKEKS